jgi:hypothetical protein
MLSPTPVSIVILILNNGRIITTIIYVCSIVHYKTILYRQSESYHFGLAGIREEGQAGQSCPVVLEL